MKRTELTTSVVALVFDIVALVLSAYLAYELRPYLASYLGPVQYLLPQWQYWWLVVRTIPLIVVIFAFLGLYHLRSLRRIWVEWSKVLLGVSAALLIVMVGFFFDPQLFPSRFILLAAWALGVVLVSAGRLKIYIFQKWLLSRRIGLEKLVVLSDASVESQQLVNYAKQKTSGYDVVAEINFDAPDLLSRLEKLYQKRKYDEVWQTQTSLIGDATNLQLVEFLRNKGVRFTFAPNLFDVQLRNVEVEHYRGVPMISLRNTPLSGWRQVAKRVFDIAASLACLILVSPVFVALAIAIKLDSRGRVIYAALRGGRGRDFWFYKFRSMYAHLSVGEEYGGEEAEKVRMQLWKNNDRGGEDGPFLKIKDDPRVTKVGRFLRRTKLDEIPQFWNVLKGDMSMVGPRAHVIDEVQRYRDRYPRMFSIKPGIFGVSQLAQMTWPDLPFEEEIRLNTDYIENWHMWWDVQILARTFYMLFFVRKPKSDY